MVVVLPEGLEGRTETRWSGAFLLDVNEVCCKVPPFCRTAERLGCYEGPVHTEFARSRKLAYPRYASPPRSREFGAPQPLSLTDYANR